MYTWTTHLLVLCWGVNQLAGAGANELIARGQYQLAVEQLIQQLKDPHFANNEAERAALLSNLGMTYNKLGRYAEAETNLEKAMQIWKTLGVTDTEHYGRTLNNLANVFFNQRRYRKAEEMLRQAFALYPDYSDENTTTETRLDISLLINNIGLTVLSEGKLSEAEQLFRQSLEMQRGIKDTRHLAITLNNLGLAMREQGHLEEAAQIYTQAVQAWESDAIHNRPDLAVGFHNLAMVESALGQTSQAEAHFKQALEMVEAALPAGHPTRIAILDGYGRLLMKMRRKHEAKQLQATARALRAQHGHENFEGLTVNVLDLAR